MNIKIRIIIIFFITVFYSIGPVYAEDIQDTILKHYQIGNVYYQQGKYKQAREEFQKALNLRLEEKKAETTQVVPKEGKEIEDLIKYEEPRISLDYKEADLADVLQSLAYSYALNIVPPPDIKGKVKVSLKDVTIDEALEAVLISCGYAYYRKGNLIYIYPSLKVEDVGLITISIPLKYLTASEAGGLVSKSLSGRGDARVNEVTNSLILRDYAPILDKVRLLLKEIDTPPLQVLIEAKIIDITSKDLQNLGVTYSATYTAAGGLFKTRDSSGTTGDQAQGTLTTAGPSSSLTSGQFKLDTFIMNNWNATATIDALVQDQRARILASPSIATLNGKEARIVIGEKVPYKEKTQTTTGTTETTKFIDVGTNLRVTPQISPDGYITMAVHPEVSSVSALLDAGPRITTREADVVIRVKDGQTIVIGGLIKNEDTRVRSRIPILGYIPIVSFIFGNKSTDITQTELAVFITPHIIKESEELKKVKPFQREEVYVNITGVGGRTLVNTLFEKALRLESNQGIESRKKDEPTRMAEALDLYRTIATQFPESDKADEALYRAGKIYFWFYHDRPQALKMFKDLIEGYPQSSYYANSAYIARSIERSQGRERLQPQRKRQKNP